MNLQPYFKELWDELNDIEDSLKSGKGDPELSIKRKEEIEDKLSQLRAMASKQKNTYVIKTEQGYLTANSKFTDNIHHAYTYEGDDAVNKARKIKGWLEELPDCGFIK